MCAFCLQALTWDSGCSCLGLDRRTSEHVHASDASLDQLWLCILRDDVRGFLFLQMFPIDFRQSLESCLLMSEIRDELGCNPAVRYLLQLPCIAGLVST